MIDQFGLKNAKPVGTPIAEVVHAVEDMNLLNASDASLFRTLAEALLWITRCTRPIGVAVHHMTRKTFSASGTSNLAILEGTQDSKYIYCLSEYLLPFAHLNYGTEFIFQQDKLVQLALINMYNKQCKNSEAKR